MDAFDRLSPALQYQIVNDLGWTDLRLVQNQAIDVILDGANCVVLAPTAGGKTEAAFFPLLSKMDQDDQAAPSVLYIAPIRALLNNQEARLQRLSGLIGRRAFKWHGDVGASARKRYIREPADILAITPESLEAMLISTWVPASELLRSVRAVVVDEVHAFAADDRGGHLVSVLERVQRIAGRDIQRIGLSATVGNPGDICRWLSGSSERDQLVVDPGGGSAEPKLLLDYVGTLANASVVIERLYPGTKRLVFADSRRKVEELGRELDHHNAEVHVTHSSLAVSERHAAERAFEECDNCVIVATSAMELGIDVGDVDHVLQIDAPSTVSSFLQRMGRTGRRPDTHANCTFLATKDDALLLAAALIRLRSQGYIEPVTPSTRASHLLAHQIMALTLQYGGVPTDRWWPRVRGAACYADLDDTDRTALLDHMLAEDILANVDGRLILSDHGQKLYSGRNFMDLYVVFSTPPIFRVMAGRTEIGTVDAHFVQLRKADDFTFVLAGRAWRVTHIDWRRGICTVEPAPDAGYPSWMGDPRFLSWEVCQSMREILIGEDREAIWTSRACDVIDTLRAQYAFLHDAPAPLVDERDIIRWWTFAGGRANNLLAHLLRTELGDKVTASNTAVTLAEGAGKSLVAVRQAVAALSQPGRVSREAARRAAADAARGRISKFQPCLPAELEQELLADVLVDSDGAAEAVARAVQGLT